MPITINEPPDSRAYGRDGTITIRYRLAGSADEHAVRQYILDNSPGNWDGCIREKYPEVHPVPNTVDETTDSGLWEAEVRYTPSGFSPILKKTGESTFSFEISASQSIHVMTSIKTMRKFAAYGGATIPDMKNAINVTGSGGSGYRAQGVDIPGHTFPTFPISKTRYLANSAMTTAYINTLYSLCGKVNSAPLSIDAEGQTWTFAAGEFLFLGVRGSRRGYVDDWELTYFASASPNVADACAEWTNRPPAGVVQKDGWEYLWVLFEDSPDVATNLYLPRPRAIYVEKVIQTVSMAGLGM